jgi:hypothetical protein
MGMATERGIYIVLGMHRSGTSLVAGLLHQSGITMGTPRSFKPRPNEENPKGFYENYEFRKLNDDILESSGYIVKTWNPKLEDIRVSSIHRLRMKRLIMKYLNRYHKWGWKDPRQVLTCDKWFEAIQELGLGGIVRTIFVYRHPLSVAISMMGRKNTETISHGLALWFLYNQHGAQAVEEFGLPCLVLSFERLIESPVSTLSHMSQFVDLEIGRDVFDEFISPDLVRSDFAKSGTDLEIRCDSKVTELLGRLNALESRSFQGSHY